MIKSRICEILGIRYPIIQGGMAWIADASLAAAVSNAGGLGLISSVNAGTEAVRDEIRKCRQLTDKPFGVNIMLQAPNAAEIAQLVIDEGVKVITTGEGAESGGHVGELHTMALLPQVADAVDIPVIGAGGIADARQAAAAFILGADAIQVGTRFLAAEECTVHQNYKDRILKATDNSTMVTGKTLGHPVRSLKSPFSTTFAKMEADPAVKPEEILAFGTGALRKAAKEGDPNGSYMAGEAAGLVNRIEPAGAIVDDLILGAERILRDAAPKHIA